MSIVSNTSPLRYLIEIDAVQLIPAIFGNRILVPPSVIAELKFDHFPESVKRWADNPPDWLQIVNLSQKSPFTTRLHAGEADAIALAVEVGATRILLDERDGVRIAEEFAQQNQLPLRARGTLTVLVMGAELKMIDLPTAIHRLTTQTRFRFTADLLNRLIHRDATLKALIEEELRHARESRGDAE